MPKVDRQLVEARVGRTPAQQAIWRVRRGCPEYFGWPRRLRQLYVMLATHGSSDGALRDVCEDFGWEWEETREMMAEEGGFLERLMEFRESGEYPRGVGHNGEPWKNALTHEQLSLVFAEESRFEALAKLMNVSKGAGVAQHLRDLVGNAGFLAISDPISEKPAIKADGSEAESGMVYDAEDGAAVRMSEPQKESIAGDWDWDAFSEEEEIEGVDAAPTNNA